MRKKVIAGNWKMNMLPNEAIAFIEEFTPLVKDSENEVVLCVPYTDLFYALLTAQNTNIKIGAQNMHWKESGAYTGEIAPKMLKSIGVEYVIIGHSERRQYYNETDETVNLKLKAAFEAELKPIVCVGETLEQREAGITAEIITNQTRLALDGLTDDQVKNIMKIRTANELKELNAALNNCTDTVWLMGPNDECYNMKNEEEYIEGIIRLAEDHDEQLGFFTASREDEKTMMHFLEQMAA